MVQAHKKPNQQACPKPKERAIHDLVLLKAITAKDIPTPDTTTAPDAPPEARVFLTSIMADEDLFEIDPEDCHTDLPVPNAYTSPSVAPILPQDDTIFLQASADALIHKINTLRGEKSCDLNPQAPPFTPQPSSNSTTNHCLVVTTAEVHPPPKELQLNAPDEKL